MNWKDKRLWIGILVVVIVLIVIGSVFNKETKVILDIKYCESDMDCRWIGDCCDHNYECKSLAPKCSGEEICALYVEIPPSEPCLCIDNRCQQVWKNVETDITKEYCQSVFKETGECPKDKCEICCGPDFKDWSDASGCPIDCCPKPIEK